MKDFVIAYDICNEKRLKKIAKYLERKAIRVQLSVYFLPECNKLALKHIVQKLTKMIDIQEDDLRIFEVDMHKTIFVTKDEDLNYFVV